MKLRLRFVLSLLAALMLLPVSGWAQGMDQQLPLDPQVRYGVLPNGLTYYIRHNEKPKGLADFYIAQKVGSILEEDNQRGLAHFLEHMCFNGTENFPGNSLISWLETIGVKFGRNLNAYTSIDQTVYNISDVPVGSEGVQDTVLLILHDWADGLLLDPEEIDKERGVIHNEWRTANVGQMRILESLLPVMYPGSKYGYRLPIGTMEVVDNFPPQALRDYYEAWYRPDQQGVIVVGDIDVDRIEAKIKELFGPIQMPENPQPREYFPVPDHEGTIYAIGHDSEMPYQIVQMSFLSDATPRADKNTIMFYLNDYVEHMIESMLNQRFSDMTRDPNCIFAQAGVNFGDYMVSKTKDAFDITGVSKGGALEPVLEAVYREVLRAAKGGFTQSEYDLARNDFMSSLEKQYNNREARENESYVREYVNNFIDGEAAPGLETDYAIYQQLAQMIPLDAINQAFAQVVADQNNRVVLAMSPDKEGYTDPTEESLAAVIAKVEGENLEAFVDNVKSEPLIAKLPKPGKIKKVSTLEPFGAEVWTLSNGVQVIVKKTDFKDDEIRFTAVATGRGTATYPESYAASIVMLPQALATAGLGSYTNADLEKYLKGKNVSINVKVGEYTRDIDGVTTPKDLPTFMELLYMSFVDPTIDATEYDATKSQLMGILKNMDSNPQYIFQKYVSNVLYNGSPRAAALSTEIVEAAQLPQMVEMMKGAVANAADYTFIFVGNVDIATLKPLVEQYIATLPANAKKATKGVPEFVNPTLMVSGKGVNSTTTAMTTPQSYMAIVEWGNIAYTPENRALASIAGQILSKRLLESVREREGAVYSIGASGNMFRVNPQNTVIQTIFPLEPEKKELVMRLISEEFDNMAQGVTPEELKKIQEYLIKNYRSGLIKNENWIGWIGGFINNGVDTYSGYEEMINRITPEDVASFMKALNAQGNYRVIVLDPAPAAE